MYINTIQEDLQLALKNLNLSNKFSISASDFEDYDYQTSLLFQLSKKENFQDLKESIISYLLNTGHYQSIEVTGKNYLSIKIKPLAIQNYNIKKEHVIVDYCGVNVAKQMHIGHIRSMFIGDYIAKANQHIGNQVTLFNHIGDWGNQFGFLLLYIYKNNLIVDDNKKLTDYYKKAYHLYKTDESFAIESTETVKKLQNKEEPFFSLWKKCCDISIEEMNKTTQEFNLSISSNDIKGESFYANMLPQIEKLLIDNKVATLQEDQTLVVNFDKLPTLLLKKSSGSYLYAMYDIAAIYWRINNLNPDKIIYVVDKRQELHFKQIFEISQKMGWANHCELIHIGFGFILDKQNKPLKTKSGESLYLDDLIEEGFKELNGYPYYDKLEGSYKDIVLKDTLYGALKFFDLHSNPKTDYQFDWDNILNPKGGTAPYIQHAYVRIDSILFKQSVIDEETLKNNFDVTVLSPEGESLFKQTIKTLESIYTTTDNYSCHLLEEQLINLCKKFHLFYEHENISKSEFKDNQLGLIIHVKDCIEEVCNVFGISLYLSTAHYQHKISQLKKHKI